MTEAVNPDYVDLDIWSAQKMIDTMYDGQLTAMHAIAPALKTIAQAAEATATRLGEHGRLVYAGAGTSGRLAILDGAELGPTFGWPRERLVYLMAGGPDAILNAVEGAEDDNGAGQQAIEDHHICASDVFIGVAASGRTPYTLAALRAAKTRGALTIAITNNADTPLATAANYDIIAITGPEILAGSTRMKAGTAQKAILTMLSTAIMTRMGRVYNGLMVDMIPSNAKLKIRATDMVCKLAACSESEAGQALHEAEWHIKTAVLMATGLSFEDSRAKLEKSDQNLRKALESRD